MSIPRAVVLLSGGLDSATTLAIAQTEGFQCYALSFDYGQRHRAELAAAERVAHVLGAHEHRVMRIDFAAIGGSALTDMCIPVPETPLKHTIENAPQAIPVTYVPARNTVFLSLSLAWAEVLNAADIFIGVNAVDYSGYPDCRPAFIQAFENLATLATKAGITGQRFHIHAPLLKLTKADIIRRGIALGVDFSCTVSCYQANAQGEACGLCDSCQLRQAGFAAAGVVDSTRYC